MGKTYKKIVKKDRDSNIDITRVMKISSYRLKAQDFKEVLGNTVTNPTSEGVMNTIKNNADITTYWLPMPNSVDDTTKQNWTSESATDSLIDMSPLKNIKNYVKGFTGISNKPYYFQYYTGHEPRSVNLNITLNANNKEEFDEINNILLNLKADMLPGSPSAQETSGNTTEGNASVSATATEAAAYILQTPPALFSIVFGDEKSHINTIMNYSLCVLTNMDISIGTDGKMSTYEDGSPKLLTVSFSFSEFEPKERDDWEKL